VDGYRRARRPGRATAIYRVEARTGIVPREASKGERKTVAILRELLSERDYRTLLASQFLGQGAEGVAQAVLATILVLDPLEEGTPARILSIFALTLLPYSLISPFLGVLVDRWDRRRLLVATNVVRCVIVLTAPLWTAAWPGETPLLLGALGLLGLGRLFHTAKGAVLPVVLHEHHLLRGNALSSVGGTLSLLAGGGVGLWLAEVASLDVALTAVGGIYALAAMFAARIKSDLSHPHAQMKGVADAVARVARGLLDGVRAILARPSASISLAAIFFLRTFTVVVIIGVIILIKSAFRSSSAAGALALGAVGVGAFLAALSAPRLGRSLSKPQLILAGFTISGLGIVALGGIASLPAIVSLMAIGGYGSFLTKVSVDSQVQEALPDLYRGRAFALYDILYNVAGVAAGSIVVLFQGASIRSLLIGVGICNLLVTAGVAAAMRGAGMLPSMSAPARD
jgi:Major Facilitator Superfamily